MKPLHYKTYIALNRKKLNWNGPVKPDLAEKVRKNAHTQSFLHHFGLNQRFPLRSLACATEL